jgi:catechol 2,3-dioxygenase
MRDSKVASDSDLDTFARRIKEHGIEVEEIAAGEQPGLGRRLSFIVPTGHRIELFSEMALSDHGPMTRNPEIWREEPHGMRVTTATCMDRTSIRSSNSLQRLGSE